MNGNVAHGGGWREGVSAQAVEACIAGVSCKLVGREVPRHYRCMSMLQAQPTVLCTIGMHGSASTWVFNVARELLGATFGEAQILPFFADRLEHLPDARAQSGLRLIIKSHEGSDELEAWLDAAGAQRILSIRDPRDAVLSLVQRFGMGLNPSVGAILRDAARVQRLAANGAPIWRYEDRFYDSPESVGHLASQLGLTPPAELQEAIFQRYRTAAVREFANSLSTLPETRLTQVGPFAMDKVTQILGPHIGDGTIGKWRGLPAQLQLQLNDIFGPFLAQFGYAEAVLPG